MLKIIYLKFRIKIILYVYNINKFDYIGSTDLGKNHDA